MTESPQTPENAPETAEAAPVAAPRKSSGGLGGKVLAELQQIATDLGVENIQGMRKGALIDAIKEARGDAPKAAKPAKADPKPAKEQSPKSESSSDDAPKGDASQTSETKGDAEQSATKKSGPKRADAKQGDAKQADGKQADGKQDDASNDGDNSDGNGKRGNQQNKQGNQQGKQGGQPNKQGGDQQNKQGNQQNKQGNQNTHDDDDDEGGSGRRRNRRGRNRNRGMEAEPTYSEDDVLVPAAGILDILDNYAFVRTTGYLPSEQDVYVSLSMVRKWGLRRGDAVTGQVRQPREGERKEKFNPMVKVESVNGLSLDDAAKRVEYEQLVAVHPADRLRLDATAGGVTSRVVDLVAPVGKGQRGLVTSDAGAGKTTTVHHLAAAITENHPECHLMVVLVDQRPEEITDFQRSVKGEVIASAFDRSAGDHTTVAELAIERAKRLVELGHDVVVLVDGIGRLGHAYLTVSAGSNRAGNDAAALLPVKAFLGAARNIEDGGSLTVIGTTGAGWVDDADVRILDELEGVANWAVRLDGDLADARLFPAIEVASSGTRHEDRFVDAQETAVMRDFRAASAEQGDVSDACCSTGGPGVTKKLIEQVSATASNAETLLKLKQS